MFFIKNTFRIFFAVYILFTANVAFAQAPDLSSDFVILIDSYTGKVFYEKNADSKAYPASTTKILTLITALENNSGKDTVTVSANAAAQEGSTNYLRANEKYHLHELFYGMMLESGNDTATAIAEHVGGNTINFAKLMNAMARIMGAKNSNFVNPSGLPDNNHYTTARDMSMIARHAMQNQMFRNIVSTYKKDWSRKNPQQKSVITNTNMLLDSYFGVTGIKTGQTNAAKKCLVASVKRKDIELIAVFFHSEPYCWSDARKLFDYGFSIIEPKVVYRKGDIVKTLPVSKGVKKADVIVNEDVVLPINDDFDKYKIEVSTAKKLFAPLKKGQEAGNIRVFHDGKEIKKIPLYTNEDIAKKEVSDSLLSGF